mgnify:CR=1 FL=1
MNSRGHAAPIQWFESRSVTQVFEANRGNIVDHQPRHKRAAKHPICVEEGKQK